MQRVCRDLLVASAARATPRSVPRPWGENPKQAHLPLQSPRTQVLQIAAGHGMGGQVRGSAAGCLEALGPRPSPAFRMR